MYNFPPRAKKLMFKVLEMNRTMEDVARELGISRATLGRKLTRDCEFNRVHIDRFRKYMNLTHEELFYFFIDPNRNNEEIPRSDRCTLIS